jgi:hypothetical protein
LKIVLYFKIFKFQLCVLIGESQPPKFANLVTGTLITNICPEHLKERGQLVSLALEGSQYSYEFTVTQKRYPKLKKEALEELSLAHCI